MDWFDDEVSSVEASKMTASQLSAAMSEIEDHIQKIEESIQNLNNVKEYLYSLRSSYFDVYYSNYCSE